MHGTRIIKAVLDGVSSARCQVNFLLWCCLDCSPFKSQFLHLQGPFTVHLFSLLSWISTQRDWLKCSVTWTITKEYRIFVTDKKVIAFRDEVHFLQDSSVGRQNRWNAELEVLTLLSITSLDMRRNTTEARGCKTGQWYKTTGPNTIMEDHTMPSAHAHAHVCGQAGLCCLRPESWSS